MSSQIEILEYLLINYPRIISGSELGKVFNQNDRWILLKKLVNRGFVKCFVKINGKLVECNKELLKTSKRKYYTLSENAFKYLNHFKKDGKVSFLFTPMAERYRYYLNRPDKKYIFEK